MRRELSKGNVGRIIEQDLTENALSLLLLPWKCAVQNELGKGAFQELDQVKAVQQFCKYAGQASSAKDIVPTVTAAVKVCATPMSCMASPAPPPSSPPPLKLSALLGPNAWVLLGQTSSNLQYVGSTLGWP